MKYVMPTSHGRGFVSGKTYPVKGNSVYGAGRVMVENDMGVDVVVRVDGVKSCRLEDGVFKLIEDNFHPGDNEYSRIQHENDMLKERIFAYCDAIDNMKDEHRAELKAAHEKADQVARDYEQLLARIRSAMRMSGDDEGGMVQMAIILRSLADLAIKKAEADL